MISYFLKGKSFLKGKVYKVTVFYSDDIKGYINDPLHLVDKRNNVFFIQATLLRVQC